MYSEAKLSVRPEEQITNVLVLLKGPPPRAAPSGGRDALAAESWAAIKDIKSEGSAVSQQATTPDLTELE